MLSDTGLVDTSHTIEREDYKCLNIAGKVEVFTHSFVTDVGRENLKESY